MDASTRLAALAAALVAVAFAAPLAGAQGRTASPASADLRRAWQQTQGSPSVRIAVLDTGVEPLAALAANLQTGFDLLDGTPARSDGNGHGTAMASIAAAPPGNRAGVPGVCGRCTIVPVTVVGPSGFGTPQLAAAGVRWAIASGVNVINISLTSPVDDPSLDAAISDAVRAGIVVVLAAGNGGSSEPAVGGYPAGAAPEAITVGGVDASGRLYPWSNHGPWVELGAPGVLPALTIRGAAFSAAGTSASAAYVSGVVGLMLSVNPSLTPAQAAAILARTGTPEPGLDVATGRVVDAAAAVEAAAA